jgi:rod shape-determining protein MreC
MQQIINFIVRYKTALLYILFLIISLAFTANSHSYHRSKFFNSANWISGTVYTTSDNITSYFNLEEENKRLLDENKRLRKLLFNREMPPAKELDTATLDYTIQTASIIKNSYANPNNYITINKGRNQGIKQDMGVITSRGILGIVEHTTANFSAVQSILNSKSTINAKIKNTNYFGSLVWDGKNYNVVQLEDIPRLVPVLVGDTIVTGAMSSIFPENIPIGTIKKYTLNESQSFYNIDVELFNDMTNLKNVYLIENTERPEVQELESKISNDQ